MKKKRFSVAFLSFIFIPALLIFFTSCRKKESITPVSSQPIDSAAALPSDTLPDSSSATRFLALGDSYSIGQSVDSSARFPAQVAALLKKQDIQIAPIIYIAATGWTTLNLKSTIELQNPEGPFGVVTLLIGVNDQYQTHDTTNYRSRFTNLLDKALALAGNQHNRVFVLSIPDYGVTPFGSGITGVGEQIDLFNAINKDVTDNDSITYTNITDISRADAGDNTMLAPDGLHPSGKQYAKWADILAPKMYEVLK